MRRTAIVAVMWALLGSGAGFADAQLVRGDPPPFMLGHFVDDYGIPYSITRDAWVQGRAGRYTVVEWDPEARWALLRSGSASASGSEVWTRIDWVELGGPGQEYPWAYCYGAYDQPDAEAARSAPASRRDSPRTGCNGFPFSRMKRADESVIAIARNTTDRVSRITVRHGPPLWPGRVARAGHLVHSGGSRSLTARPRGPSFAEPWGAL